MAGENVRRFALILLENNGHLESFEVDVFDRALALELIGAFEELGCRARVDRHRAILTVECPPEALTRAFQPNNESLPDN